MKQVFEIRWQPLAKQEEALKYLEDDSTTELFYGGAAGGGKSFLGCAWIILNCIRYPGTRWLMGRAILKDLKQSTLLTFFHICKLWGLQKGSHYTFHYMEGVIKWINGSEVYLKDLFQYPSDPEYDSLGSTEYTGGFIDEASQINNKAKMIVMSRIRYKLEEFGLIPKLLVASNPCKNFLYTEFYRPWKDGKLPVYRKFVVSKVQDNKHISPHYIENLKKLDKTSKERLLYGNFEYDDDPSKLFDIADINDMFHLWPENRKEKALVCDVARLGNDMTTITYWEGLLSKRVWYHQKKRLDETEAFIKKLEKQYGVKRSRIVIDEDGVGGGVVDHLSGCRGFVNNGVPIPQRGGMNYRNLKTQCYYVLSQMVQEGKIGVAWEDVQAREMLVQDLEQIKIKDADKDGKMMLVGKDRIRENIGRSPDFSDNLMMRMLLELNRGEMMMLTDPDNVTGLF